ncbi:MAG: N-acetyl-gamma-glutamyl-phosphate reductase [Candidatus Eremiobacteraeota bacterium]|nr:N-acetyl-gamma-glutamyl-phosphate reductase [Candidatus Eremiobacteraeota bacterium]
MTRVHVWGAAGYAAAQAIEWIAAHPRLELALLESKSHAGTLLGESFGAFRRSDLRFAESGSIESELAAGEIVLAAGAHGQGRDTVERFLARGARVVDLSADFRFDERAAYGLAEWNRDAIAEAALVANPGCYPTASLLPLLPLTAAFAPLAIVIDAKSGITGAGRTPALASMFAEVDGEIRAYGLSGHRHQPEIERALALRGCESPLTFTPHVVPLSRGMLADTYLMFDRAPDPHAVESVLRDAYRASPFVRILEPGRAPSVAAVVGTNDAEIAVDLCGKTIRAICAIDNLGKGAAGQALQNINIMLGYPQEEGFHARTVAA